MSNDTADDLCFSCSEPFFTNFASAACNVIGDKMYGDCSNVTIGKPKGLIRVTSFRSEDGIIDGAIVLPGGHLEINGICQGDVFVQKGGKLSVTGQVGGTIHNKGSADVEGQADHIINSGPLAIGGVVSSVSGKGKITYRKGAVVSGIPH